LLRPRTILKPRNELLVSLVVGKLLLKNLMRIWRRVPICKSSRPDYELEIQTHTIVLRKERKEVISWAEVDL
jgi:hypothetical protein